MTPDEIVDQLAQICFQHNCWGDSLAEIVAHYRQAYAKDYLSVIQEQGVVVAYLEWVWIRGPRDAQRALEGEPTNGPCLYVKDLYVAPGRSNLIWVLRRRLPDHDVLYCHRAKYGNRLDCHYRPQVLIEAA